MALQDPSAAAAAQPAAAAESGNGSGNGAAAEENYVLHAGRALGSDFSAYLDFDPARYEEKLQAKVATLLPALAPFMAADASSPEVFRSPARHHRLRIKLGVGVLPAAGAAGASSSSSSSSSAGGGGAGGERLTYLMWDPEGRPVPVADFPIASRRINALMPRLLAAVEAGPLVLRRGLRAVNFLDTLAGDVLVSLMYSVPISDDGDGDGDSDEPSLSWAVAARVWLRDGLGVQVVGRSRGVVIPLDRAYVMEALDISRPPPPDDDGEDEEQGQQGKGEEGRGGEDRRHVLRYKQVEGAFCNPNGHMAVHTLRWLCARADTILPTRNGPCDLLELYCGNGNHTVALARKFRRVVGVEINKHLVAVARENLALNGIAEGKEALVIQIPAEKFRPSRLDQYRRQQRQDRKEGDGEEEEPPFDFGCVLVDPPRAGLDRYTRKLVSHYDHVLYVSCGPQSLVRDLRGEGTDLAAAAASSPEGRRHLALAPFGLGSTHEIVAAAVLDHFPFTTHIEAAVHLRRRRKAEAAGAGDG